MKDLKEIVNKIKDTANDILDMCDSEREKERRLNALLDFASTCEPLSDSELESLMQVIDENRDELDELIEDMDNWM